MSRVWDLRFIQGKLWDLGCLGFRVQGLGFKAISTELYTAIDRAGPVLL